jgi:hypothetical protein
MHSGLGTLHRVENLERVRQGEIRLRTDEQIPSGKCLRISDQDRTCPRRSRFLHIFRVVEEAQMLRLRGIERPDATDLEIPVTDHVGAEIGGEVRKLFT